MAKEVTFKLNLKVDGKDVVRQLSVDVEELQRAIGDTRSASEKFTASLIKWNQLSETIGNLHGALSQLSGTLNSVTAESRSFGGAMASANTMAGKGGEEFANLKAQVSELSKTIPIARDELANGLYQVISNGVPEDNWIEYLEKSAKASVGGIADLGETVKVTSTIIKNYGLEWGDAGSIQDKIQLTAKNGVTSFEQLAQALPRVTSNAATLGVSVDELMATFSTLTGVSGNTAEVSTQLAAIFTALVKPSSEAAEMARQMGIQFDAAAIKAAGGMEQFLTSLDKSVKQYAASSGMLEQEIYGKLFGSAESLRALGPLTGQLADKFKENVADMKNSAGTIDDAFDKMASTGSATLQMLNNKFGEVTDAIQSNIGNVLPYLNFGSQIVGTVSSVGQLAVAMKTLGATTKVTAAITSTFGPIVQVCSATMRGAAVSAETLKLAIRGLMVATGVGVAITALSVAIDYLTTKSSGAKNGVAQLSQAQLEAQQAHQAMAQRLSEVRTELDQNISKLKDFKGSKEQERAMVQQLNAKYGEAFGYYSTVSQWYNALISDSKAYCAQLEVEAQIEARKNQIKKLAEKQMSLVYDEKGNKRTYTKTTYSGGGDYYTYTDKYGRKATGISRGKATTTTWTGEQTKGYQQAQQGIDNLTKSITTLQQKADSLARGIHNGSNTNPTPAAIPAPATPSTSGGGSTDKNKEEYSPLAGSIDWYDKQIEEKRKQLQAAANEATAKTLNTELEGLQRSLYMLKVRVGIETPPGSDITKMLKPVTGTVTESLADMQAYMEKHPLHVEVDSEATKKLKDLEAIKGLQNVDLTSFESVSSAMQSIKDIGDPTAKTLATAGSACQALGSAMQQLGADSGAAKAGMVMAAIGQIVLSFAQALRTCHTWVEWLAFGISGTAQLTSLIATVSKFATGGIVGGNQTTGDKVLVRVNSGEMILNASQQARLFALANGAAVRQPAVNAQVLQGTIEPQAGTKKSVSLRLRGRDLVGAVANETRMNRRRSNIKI